ncbi:MAG: universal stress protein [Kofleriaceae bacterium]|nr:universal stress protein [Kofleriaceae bacterium]
MVQRVAQLPLADDARLTIVEAARRRERSPLMLLALGVLSPRREIHWASYRMFDPFVLRDLARDHAAELVVVGSDPFLGWRIADVLGRVPILLSRSPSNVPYRRPLVALDPTRGAREVLAYTRELLGGTDAEMSAVHVSLRGEEARRIVARLLATLGPFGEGWTRHLSRGDIRTVVARTAAATHADLLVVGSRRRPLIAQLVSRSISRGVLANVDCDVLAVPVEATRRHRYAARTLVGAR